MPTKKNSHTRLFRRGRFAIHQGCPFVADPAFKRAFACVRDYGAGTDSQHIKNLEEAPTELIGLISKYI